jgi:predicted nuclease of predicted toxin-antitoxin system
VRVLLDEQLPRQLARHFAGHEVRTVQQQAWAGLKNGVLLTTAQAAGFQVFVTGDRNLEHQQNMAGRQLGVIVLVAPSNALEDLTPLVPEALIAITAVRPGQLLRVTVTDSSR